LVTYTEKFDNVKLENFSVGAEEIELAKTRVPEKLKLAIQKAKQNIYRFHSAQKTEEVKVEIQKGVNCWQKKLSIEKVGLYIPGGSAALFSTILMLAVPAQVAGCSKVVLCSPPDLKGELPDVILYTADLCGIDTIFKLGGMQAIAGMTFGTATIPKVDKLFGPGNQFVTVAKQLATQYQVSIDMPAGPSELMVVADATANPAFVASDLLSQAEHGPDSQVLLVTTDRDMIERVDAQVELQISVLERKETALKALGNSKIIYFDKVADALAFTNFYGAEHLIVCVENEDEFVNQIKHAGSVFIGNYTPESAGDYASGTNHTLPTNGYVRQYSGVNLDSFLKAITYQKITAQGLQDLGPVIEEMATAEGLQAHKNAVSIRLKNA
ncbi:MAG: histidinol dehydrogenase, partial [Bacteroidota bacterium]|nr:histidinol dehydrogenase [Bacteroidota bacterium]